MEKEERRSKDRTPNRKVTGNSTKILEKDEGCEKLSKNYHVSVLKPSILKQEN